MNRGRYCIIKVWLFCLFSQDAFVLKFDGVRGKSSSGNYKWKVHVAVNFSHFICINWPYHSFTLFYHSSGYGKNLFLLNKDMLVRPSTIYSHILSETGKLLSGYTESKSSGLVDFIFAFPYFMELYLRFFVLTACRGSRKPCEIHLLPFSALLILRSEYTYYSPTLSCK